MRQPVQVLVYPVRRTDGQWEYLLLRRIPSRGGFWQGVTGGVKEGERLFAAAQRELFEETGFVPLRLEPIGYSYRFRVDEEDRLLYAAGAEEIVEHVFLALVSSWHEPVIDPAEHDEWRWCRFEEACGLLTWPRNVEALKLCDNILRAWQCQPNK